LRSEFKGVASSIHLKSRWLRPSLLAACQYSNSLSARRDSGERLERENEVTEIPESQLSYTAACHARIRGSSIVRHCGRCVYAVNKLRHS
jgi:hypothetical protein